MFPKIYILIIFGLILLLSGCITQSGTTTTSNGTGGVQTQYVCSNGNVVATAELCTNTSVKTLTLEEQLSVCSGMPEVQSGSLEDSCIEGVAAKNKDPSLCQEASRDIRPTCYAIVAVETEDMTVCQEAGTSDDRCYEEYARSTQDDLACDEISDVNSKDYCYLNIFNTVWDPTLCAKILTASQKNSCYWNAATRLQDSSYCNSITQNDQKQSCLDQLSNGGYGGNVEEPPRPH